jgi:plasmid stabilization system protein ParE
MILEFLPEASSELYEGAEYYESKQQGLGRRFRNEILEICRLIVQQPLLWRERHGGYRRVNCPVFPYYVAYFTFRLIHRMRLPAGTQPISVVWDF